METVKSTELSFKEGSSDKVYQAFIKKDSTGYVVEFAYGRRGNSLTTGTKTTKPVSDSEADKIYTKIINEKKSKGYKENGSSTITLDQHLEARDTGVRPQLLNDIEEEDLEKYLTNDEWCMQEKFDGRRRMMLTTPDGDIATNRKGLSVAINSLIMKDFAELTKFVSFPLIIDGEDMGDKIMTFDLLSHKGTYKERYSTLQTCLDDGNSVIDVVYTAWNTKDKRKFLAHCKKANAEGVVFKKVDAIYTPGRPNSGGDQMKYKFKATASCIVTGINAKRSVQLSVYDGKVLTSVGNMTIYPNQEIPEVNTIVEVEYLYYFPGGSLFQPVYLGPRDDLFDKECSLQKLKTKRPIED